VTQSPRHRIGAVSFLNTVPLIHGLDEDGRVEVIRDLPSRLADRLWEDQVDVGLIPVVEYLRGVGGDIVPGICIGAVGPVHSVKVFSRCPLERAASIAVDRGSRSSVALLRVLLAERFDHHPDLNTVEPRTEDPFAHHDTVLVIGDRALEIEARRDDSVHVYDLGALWHELTGLPFVFAAWVLSPAYSAAEARARRVELIALLHAARAAGFAHLDALAAGHATARLDAAALKRYWTRSIRYEMGEDELAGLELFAELAQRHNLCHGREEVRLAAV
jgi:chorismate dehydratase